LNSDVLLNIEKTTFVTVDDTSLKVLSDSHENHY